MCYNTRCPDTQLRTLHFHLCLAPNLVVLSIFLVMFITLDALHMLNERRGESRKMNEPRAVFALLLHANRALTVIVVAVNYF